MKRALVVIDVQESFRQRENWAATSNPEIVKQVNRLTEAFRVSGCPVLPAMLPGRRRLRVAAATRHTEPGDPTTRKD